MKIKKKLLALRVSVDRELSASLLRQLAKSADDYIAGRLKGGDRSLDRIIKRLEQFYTGEVVVRALLAFAKQHVDISDHLIVEPSAGDAAFSRNFTAKSLSFDVDPKYLWIIKANFLALTIDHDGPIAVIGNPPFSAAVQFFNHAASQANVIAMILPRSFKKDTVHRKLDRRFHLVAEMDVPANAFLCKGKTFHVPAVFQVWRKLEILRPIPACETTHPDFTFSKSEGAHFAIQRVGTNAGRIHYELKRSGKAHLFVTATDKHRAKYVETIMRELPLNRVARNTAGYPSVAMSEIVAFYSKAASSRLCLPFPNASGDYSIICLSLPTNLAPSRQPALMDVMRPPPFFYQQLETVCCSRAESRVK